MAQRVEIRENGRRQDRPLARAGAGLLARPRANARALTARALTARLWASWLGFLRGQVEGLQYPSLAAEWAWVAGRIAVIAVCYPAAYFFMNGTGADAFVYGGATFALFYNAGIAYLLHRGKARRAFFTGLALDNTTVLLAWWGVTWSLAGSAQTNDLYLVLFPILIVGVARLGGFFGAIYTVLWLAWITWANSYYYGPGAYDVEQLPVRVPLLAVAALLTLNLVAKLNAERRRAEARQAETAALAELGRVASSTLSVHEVYPVLAEMSRRLLPFDRLALFSVGESEATMTTEFLSDAGPGERAAGSSPRVIPTGLRHALRSRWPIVVADPGTLELGQEEGLPDAGPARRAKSILIAPVRSGERVIALLMAESEAEGAFTDHHLRIADGIAASIAGALANALSYLQALQLAGDQDVRTRLDAWNRELKESSEEKTNFLSAVTHELKTPLTSIMAFNDILLHNRQANLTATDIKHLMVVRRNAERLKELIADLLDITRLIGGSLRLEKREFDIGQALDEIAATFEPILSGKRQRLSTEVVARGATLTGDRLRVVQVVSNLLSNASKYSPPGSEMLLRAWVDQDRLHVLVRDHGIGIAKEDVPKLFSPFFRAANRQTRAQQGTGLGLMISKGIVQAHGGEISVESELGLGTTVRFNMPGAWLGDPGPVGPLPAAGGAPAPRMPRMP